MAIIPVPARLAFASVEVLKLQRQSNTVRSYFLGTRQTVMYPFAVWFLDGPLVDSEGFDAADLRSFLVQLEGPKNTFELPVPGAAKPLSGYVQTLNTAPPYIGGVGTTQAAAARASSFTVENLHPIAGVPYLRNGDYFTVNNELKMATASVATDANGRCVVSFKPPLRKALPYGTTMVIENPYILMHAIEDDVAKWGLTKPVRHSFKLNAVEEIV